MVRNNNNSNILNKLISQEDKSQIDSIVENFKKDKETELEFSFIGLNYQNYLRILQYYIDAVDKENISTRYSLDASINLSDGSTYRVTFLDEKQIDQFMLKYTNANQNDILKYLLGLSVNEHVQIIFKDRGSADKHFINNINVVVKNTKEIPVTKSTTKPKINGNEKIVYRYKERVEFKLSTQFRLDITLVKESIKLWNLQTRIPKYEFELEIIDRKINLETIIDKFIDVLTVIQDTNIPIGKLETKHVIDEYHQLLGLKEATHLDSRNVISLESHHVVNFIPNKYAITDKADGDRHFLFSIPEGVYLLSVNLDVKKLDLEITDKKYHYMILDGELIENDNGNMFMTFDVIYADKIDYRYNKFILKDRINILNEIIDKCFSGLITFSDYVEKNKDLDIGKIKNYYTTELKKYWSNFRKALKEHSGIFISRKLYFIPYGIDPSEIFMYAHLVWKLYVYEELPPYKLDGIIYTPTNTPYLIKATPSEYDTIPLEYKWKKPSQNSIDFYIKFEKDEHGEDAIFYDSSVKHDTGNAYKICHLYVGLVQGSYEKPIPFKVNGIEQKANIYLIDGEARDNERNIIEDRTVVEFIYDNVKNDIDDAYKWIPIKTRYDKTESVIKYGKRYGNNISIANRIWRAILNPITEDTISALADINTYQKEIDRISKSIDSTGKQTTIYYQKKTSDGADIRAYHNFIKSNMILTYASNAKSVLDIGCGRGGDLIKFINAKIGEYVGTDIDNNGLYMINDSAYKRYKNLQNSMKNVPPMYFINADARGLFNVKSQEKIFINMPEKNKDLISVHLSGKKKYRVINVQFSLHYMVSDEISWSNFCKNISDHLDDNGYLLITCFDGKLLYDKLSKKQKITITYTDSKGHKNTFFEILKVYNDADGEANGSKIGMAIDVYNSLISNPGTYIREYLVFPDFLQESLKKNCGLELVESDSFFNIYNLYKNYFAQEKMEELEIIDMNASSYNKIRDLYLKLNSINDKSYTFSNFTVDQQSFSADEVDIALAGFKMSILNRYYVFKKTVNIDITEPKRISGINHRVDVGYFLTPYFSQHDIIIDPGRKTRQINKIYHAIRKQYTDIRPNVYLIRHTIPEEGFDNELYKRNKLEFLKVKEGTDKKTLLIYKSPEKIFYPIYYQTSKGNKYLMDSGKMLSDLDILVELTNKTY